MASGRFLDYVAQGLAAARPVAATLAGDILTGAGAFYFAYDTGVLSVLDTDGPAWVEYPSAAVDAGDVVFTPAGSIAATDVQAAIEELDSEKASIVYVDNKVAGLSWKQAVRAATTAALTLASDFENGDTIDGVTLATGDRVLIKNQASGVENGIYTVNASGAPTRATDADSGAELVNASVYVSEGTTLADTQWTCTTNATITVGVTSLAFAQLTSGGGSGDMLAANNLSDVASKVVSKDNISVKGSDIASASTTDLSAATGDFVDITGTTTITAFGTSAAGVERTLRFSGILTLTHNATSLILPTAANITTAAGDAAIFRSLGSGNWCCISFHRASGRALAGGAWFGSSYGSVGVVSTTSHAIKGIVITPYKNMTIDYVIAQIDPAAAGEDHYAQIATYTSGSNLVGSIVGTSSLVDAVGTDPYNHKFPMAGVSLAAGITYVVVIENRSGTGTTVLRNMGGDSLYPAAPIDRRTNGVRYATANSLAGGETLEEPGGSYAVWLEGTALV